MPQYTYKGRDREGNLRVGQRFGYSVDTLNVELIKEGISPIQIAIYETERSFLDKVRDRLQGDAMHMEELSMFARQMQLLHTAGVPITTALRQLLSFTRSYRLKQGLQGAIEHIEMGQDLATAMEHYPAAFSPLIISIVRIGESTGHLSEAFGHLHTYLEFESNSLRQIKSAFRYPIFVFTAIGFAIVVLNIFVIPTFSKFYMKAEVSLPWETQLLMAVSNFFVDDGVYLLIFLIVVAYFTHRYLKTAKGKYRWHQYQLRIPFIGKLLQRIILIRFSQSLSIILNSGIPMTQGLTLVKNLLNNAYINLQISQMQESIERGNTFTQSITNIPLFTPLELQILAVGEKNGELGPSLSYIGNFHAHEIEFDLKRMNDFIGPILISAVAGLILIMSLGIYLPIWNMINLVH